MKKDITKIFIDKIYSTPPRKKNPTNKMVYNHIDGISSIALADFSDYKIRNTKGFTYRFVIYDNCLKSTWCIPLKEKC